MRRTLCVLLGSAALALALATPAAAAPGDPLFTFVPTTTTVPKVQPVGYLIGPCGLAVDSSGRIYISDYYHHTVDLFTAGSLVYTGQLANVDPLNGPCGLALDSTDRLYVDDFDRNVARYGASPGFGTATILTGAGVDESHPTGVAVDPATDNAYVNDRAYITGFDKNGAQLTSGAQPLRIGLGTLGESYGLTIDATGRLYVADATDDTVKVYDPATSLTTPVKTITGPPGGFTSLRHAALAVDRASGVLYVVDDLQPKDTEKPNARVDVFNPNLGASGTYLGVLKYEIVDAMPAGIAVNQANGDVYVTSGNTNQAGIYGYAAGSQVASAQPPTINVLARAVGSGSGAIASDLGELECATECSAQIRSGATVTLSATPDPGSTFEGWSGGGCSGVEECMVVADQARTVSAEFEAAAGSGSPVSPQSLPGPVVGMEVSPVASISAAVRLRAQRRAQARRRHRRAMAKRQRRHHRNHSGRADRR